ncbi:DUF3710 domain-containing protein [Demetria terragena]|uniref:DUF3710 domain-containing protein n=1 Tax=Demetria terragena TaxID=63959 RepID=UPI0003641280|nr:DUF3710 domain-containing protein [Demetria terragena]
MGIFRRKKAVDEVEDVKTDAELEQVDGEDVDGEDVSDSADLEDPSGEADESDESDEAREETDAEDESDDRVRLPRPYDLDRSNGPFDSSEVDDTTDKLDLGALTLTPFAGSELRLDVDEEGQNVTGVTVAADESALQVQVFAAPKSSGVWDGIRDELADNLIASGGTAEEKEGDLGIELHARMPAKGANGRTTYTPVRFIGVDGPRWFIRGVLSGRAAVEDDAAEPFLGFVRDAIVTRGGEARAPRELLELTIPAELLEQAPAPIEPVEGAEDTRDKEVGDFKPFERGPEITEVR